MSIRSYVRRMFVSLAGKDLTPDYEACLLALQYKNGSLKVAPEKSDIIVEASCGFDPIGGEYSFIEDVIYSADNLSDLAAFEKEIERQEAKLLHVWRLKNRQSRCPSVTVLVAWHPSAVDFPASQNTKIIVAIWR